MDAMRTRGGRGARGAAGGQETEGRRIARRRLLDVSSPTRARRSTRRRAARCADARGVRGRVGEAGLSTGTDVKLPALTHSRRSATKSTKNRISRCGGGRLYPLAELATLARIDAQGDSSRASHPTDMLDINLFRTDKGGDPVRAPSDAQSPRDRAAPLGRTSSNPPLAGGGRRFRVASRPLPHPPRASCDSTHLAPPIV